MLNPKCNKTLKKYHFFVRMPRKFTSILDLIIVYNIHILKRGNTY